MAKHQQRWQPRRELLGKSEQWEDFHILQPPGLLHATLLQLSPSSALNPSSLHPCASPFHALSIFRAKLSITLS